MMDILETLKTFQFQDPMKAYREAMQTLQFQDPMKAYREAMQSLRFQDPMKAYREAMQSLQFQDPMKAYREATQSLQFQDPMKAYREAMESLQFQDSMKTYREATQSLQFQDPMKALREAMKTLQFQNPVKAYLDVISTNKLISPNLREKGAFTTSDFKRIFKTISRDEWPEAYAPFEGDIQVNSDNTITLDSAIIGYPEIHQIANDIVAKAFNRCSNSFESAVAALVLEIKSLKDPIHIKILSFFVYPIIVAVIVSFINPVADFYIKNLLNSKKREIEKTIKTRVIATAPNAATLDLYRLVSKQHLDVREKASAKSAIHGRLYFGQVVVLIEKRKDWSLVAWSDDENKLAVKGWVFSRYLSKFR